MQKLAIYDMDRTITRRGTYTPFLFHMVFARAPWRLIFLPILPFGFIAYGLEADKSKGSENLQPANVAGLTEA